MITEIRAATYIGVFHAWLKWTAALVPTENRCKLFIVWVLLFSVAPCCSRWRYTRYTRVV